MSLALAAIAFNETGSGAPGSALNLRRNALALVPLPEWQRGLTRRAADSVVCYALDEIGSHITARVAVDRLAPEVSRFEIRALRINEQDEVPWWVPWFSPVAAPAIDPSWLASWRAAAAWLWGTSSDPGEVAPDNLLGDVQPAEGRFEGSSRAIVEVEVPVGALAVRGAGVGIQHWRWEWREPSAEGWRPLGTSRHTIYAILSRPTLPWTQQPFVPANTQVLWADVLDLACRWAAGARTTEEAAERITHAVNDLGRLGVLEYDCVGPGVGNLGTPHYTLLPGTFDCTAFLERVRGGFGNGRLVNCSDCAAMVGTLANAVGCDLWQSRMLGLTPFPLNPTLAIGRGTWLSPCGIGAFAMHEVAWTDGCAEDDEVFDACLAVDGDADPTRPPHVLRLPTGMRFGRAGEGAYLDRLVAPAGRLICRPNPPGRMRRVLF